MTGTSGDVKNTVDTIMKAVDKAGDGGGRLVIALAGPPGAGKSTIADGILERLGADAAVLPMDGFHLDNRILERRGLLARKGAPETFDAAGYASVLARAAVPGSHVIHPVFDRDRDIAIAGAGEILPTVRFLLTEGNYLLLNRAPWTDVHHHFHVPVLLAPPVDVLERRLVERWLQHGLSPDDARARALGNDIPNARLVVSESVRPELVIANA